MPARGLYAQPPPPQAHRVVKFIYYQMKTARMSLDQMDAASGVPATSILRWFKCRAAPTLPSLLAVLAVLGYDLKPTPLADQPLSVPASEQITLEVSLGEERAAPRGRRSRPGRAKVDSV